MNQPATSAISDSPFSPRWYEWLLPAAAALILPICTWILSPHFPLWLDEVYTYYAVAHDSFGAFWRSYASHVNAAPPLYFCAVWILVKFVPLSALSLRIFSSLACGVGIFFIWAMLRRHGGFLVSSVATLTVCFCSELILFHSAEGRFYGLYFALAAWATYNYDRLCTDSPPNFGRLLANALSHALMISCTYVAGFYSLAILFSLLIRDRTLRLWRPAVYQSVAVGIALPLVIYIPLIRSQRGATDWVESPVLSTVYHPFDPGLDTYFVVCALAGLVAIASFKKNGPIAGGNAVGGHLVLLGFAFVLIPYALLLITWAGFPLLVGRYALPSLIGIALLLEFVCDRLIGGERQSVSERLLAAVLLAGLLAYPLVRAVRLVRAIEVEPVDSRTVDLGKNLPFATCDPISYFPRYLESGENHNIYWIVPDRKERDRYLQFNDRLNPITAKDFLADHERFQVISDSRFGHWFEDQLRADGNYEIKSEPLPDYKSLLMVSRK